MKSDNKSKSFDWFLVLKVLFWIVYAIVVIWSWMDNNFNSKLAFGIIFVGLWWLFESSMKGAIRDGIENASEDYFVKENLKEIIKEAIKEAREE